MSMNWVYSTWRDETLSQAITDVEGDLACAKAEFRDLSPSVNFGMTAEMDCLRELVATCTRLEEALTLMKDERASRLAGGRA